MSTAAAATEKFKVRATQSEPVLAGASVPLKSAPKNEAAQNAQKKAPKVTWPKGGDAFLEPGSTVAARAQTAAPARSDVGGLPVGIRSTTVPFTRAGTAAAPAAPANVKVSVKNQAHAEKAGINGVLMAVEAGAGAPSPGKVELAVDYSAFAGAFGANFAGRMRVVQYPACVLTTPEKAECKTATPVDSGNDVKNKTLTARIALPGTGTGSGTKSPQQLSAMSAAAAAPMVLAAEGGASGTGGDFKATPLAPTSSWQSGGASGDFNWTYPMSTPEAPGDLSPELGLNYSAQSVDGRMAAGNTQPSQAGDGFELTSGGFIERRFQPCSDVPGSGVAYKDGKGDLCFASENAMLSLNGSGTELVRDDATGTWKGVKDDGSRIEYLTGASNGDAEGGYFRLTTVSGTVFTFGLNRPGNWKAGDQETNSAFTVPLYGKDGGKQRAWRYNLDHVSDVSGNAMVYYYAKETNRYGADKKLQGVEYTRGGHLSRVEYGLRTGAEYGTKAPAKVLIETGERCLPGADCSDAKFTKENAKNWPDVPVDQYCAPGKECKNQHSPTFWTRKRFSAISTQVLTRGAYKDVDRWDLTHSFPQTGDGTSNGLWLASVKHTGKTNGDLSTPEITFSGQQLANRVDGLEGLPPFIRYRINAISTESGGLIGVTYSAPECNRDGTLPASDADNTLRCYPVNWSAPGQPIGPDGRPKPYKDYFHKYVATQIIENDLVGGSPSTVTRYEYSGAPAWAYDTSEFLRDTERTWNQWRGYGKVITRTGDGADQRTRSENVYFRGLDGDRTASGGTRTVKVADSEGNQITDHLSQAGGTRETLSYNGDGGPLIAATSYEPFISAATATRNRTGTTPLTAHRFNNGAQRTRTAVEGGLRRTAVEKTYDEHGLITKVYDLGDTSTAGDDRCVRTEYARNAGKHLLDLVSRQETVSVACGATVQRPAHVISDERTHYDGKGFGGTPERGDATAAEELAEYVGGQPRYVVTGTEKFDQYGRSVETTDVLGNTSGTAYTPATGEMPHQVVTTNALGHTETEIIDPTRGRTLTEIDADGRREESEYDALGRLTKGWSAGRTRDQKPDVEVSYLTRKDGPSAVTTRTRLADDTYTVSHELYDGLMRPRQTQATRADLNQNDEARSGRVVTDTVYDSRGLQVKASGPYLEKSNPATTLVSVPDNQIIRQTGYLYDGAGRKTAELFYSLGTEKWRSTTVYGGDRQHVVPPQGATVTTTIGDARGNTVELRQYKGREAGGAYDSTRYEHGPGGELLKVVDPVGNTWTHEYDLRGRKTKDTDPDRGVTTYTFDDGDQPVSTTDARGNTVHASYDKLGRRLAVRDGGPSGQKLSEWTYDTLSKGRPTSSTRHVDGKAYTTSVLGYDDSGTATGSRTTVPEGLGKLSGSYESKVDYDSVGKPVSAHLPAVGGLAAEKVDFGYNAAGVPSTLKGAAEYVSSSRYTPFGELMQYMQGAKGKRMIHTNYLDDSTRRVTKSFADREVAPSALSEVDYAYDPAGNITSLSELREGTTRDTQCFSYDYLRRMTEGWTAKTTCAGGPSAATVGGVSPYWHSYTFDPTGNRTSETKHDVGNGETRRTYTYPAAKGNQPHALSGVDVVEPTGTRKDSYAYDATGNTTLRKVGNSEQKLEWDTEGQLTKVTEGTKVTEYVYDAEGNRLLRKDPSGTTLYLGTTEVALAPDGSTKATRGYGFSGSTVAVRSSDGKVSYLSADHHNTATISVDAAGSMTATRRDMTPYGETRGAAPQAWPDQKGFVGGTVDASTGLTQLGVRSYEPATGRFLSVDPLIDIDDPQQMNGYAYANNNPVSISDPDGKIIPILVGIAIRIAAQRIAMEIARRAAIEAAKRAAAELAKRLAIEAAKKAAAEAAKKAAEEAAKKAAIEAAKKVALEAAKKQAAKEAAKQAAKKQAAKQVAKKPQAKAAPKQQAAAKKAPKANQKPPKQQQNAPKKGPNDELKKELMDIGKDHITEMLAEHARGERSHAPGAFSVGRDSTTGKTYLGASGSPDNLHPTVRNLLPRTSQHPKGRPPQVCAEARMCTNALNDGAKLKNLDIATVNTKGKKFGACENCSTWIFSVVRNVLTG
ncbi:RHS repeat domain-containing protein [Streptomyces avidinii]|uniref:RHS repeat-associated protein n=1 Tax=Streptomyces avidinii TaxID=1895 RepID=A0ABS4LA56_STRAV|nr:RHS repeat-associated core domain-containing protein [Streptomyces avidinii]MBP2038966.1 RHS repeat-associated protein [Streptomyces avidinii]